VSTHTTNAHTSEIVTCYGVTAVRTAPPPPRKCRKLNAVWDVEEAALPGEELVCKQGSADLRAVWNVEQCIVLA